VFRAQAQLGVLQQQTKPVWKGIDALVLPTAPTIYTVAQVQADPLSLNNNLGTYTNFVNLLDLCALAVPAGFRTDGLPFGITLVAPCGHDANLAALGARFHAVTSTTLGASPQTWAGDGTITVTPRRRKEIWLAVVGAHLSGEPLNRQLTDLGATLVKTARTAPHYRLFALENTAPAKPGLVRSTSNEGVAVEVEVWRLSSTALGELMKDISAPLCIGSIELENTEWVHGFLCESQAVANARDITAFGGWRSYRRSLTATH
jgi:allophanate hydrolase